MEELHPIHIENTTVNYEGWIQINFTTILREWIANKRPNNMLDITIQCQNAKHQMETPSIDANYLLSLWDTQRQPFITAYFKNDDSHGHTDSSKHKVQLLQIIMKLIFDADILRQFIFIRSILLLFFSQRHRSKRSAIRSNPHNQARNHRRESHPINPLLHKPKHLRSCQRHILFVSFQELQWDSWIYAPTGYGAYYCAGTCNFPFSHDVTATNHAIVQTLAHLLQSNDIPKPCCAPSKLQSISLLYSQSNDQFHIKRYREMIAKTCVCQ